MIKKLFIFLVVIATIPSVGEGQIITTVVGGGNCGGGGCGDGGQATDAELLWPNDVVLDAFGNLYISDFNNNLVRKVNTLGIINTIAGGNGVGGDGGLAIDARLNGPLGINIDGIGNIYIADNANNKIRMVNTLGIISTLAGNGSQGNSGDGGQATDSELNRPTSVAIDAVGNLYISDFFNNRIRKVSTMGIISNAVGNGTGGWGDGGQATDAVLASPNGINFDSHGNLYIAEQGNGHIRKVDTNGIINTVAGGGANGLGDGGQATNAELNTVYKVAADSEDNLYLTDYGNNRIRKVNTLGIILTVAGDSTQGFSGDGGNATNAELNPSGLTVDMLGNLYIADAGNNRIRMVSNVGQAGNGIKQYESSNEVSIYPNPNNGSFVIEPNSITKQTMQVYDVNGKVVLSQVINGKTTIDASSLNEGVYNISLISNDGVVNKRVAIVR